MAQAHRGCNAVQPSALSTLTSKSKVQMLTLHSLPNCWTCRSVLLRHQHVCAKTKCNFLHDISTNFSRQLLVGIEFVKTRSNYKLLICQLAALKRQAQDMLHDVTHKNKKRMFVYLDYPNHHDHFCFFDPVLTTDKYFDNFDIF